MKILIISLNSSLDRRENIKNQFDKIGVSFEFFNAVDGRKGNHFLFKKYNEKKRVNTKGYPLTPGELGCFASHYLIWQKCVDENKNYIVIEDDAELNPNFKQFYTEHSQKLANRYEYLRLFVNNRKRKFSQESSCGDFDIVKYHRGPGATRAYMITPSASRKFITHAHEWFLPVDDYMDQFWVNKTKCMGIMPGIVRNETDFDTTIGTQKSTVNRNFVTKIKRELNHVVNELRRIVFNIRS